MDSLKPRPHGHIFCDTFSVPQKMCPCGREFVPQFHAAHGMWQKLGCIAFQHIFCARCSRVDGRHRKCVANLRAHLNFHFRFTFSFCQIPQFSRQNHAKMPINWSDQAVTAVTVGAIVFYSSISETAKN